jgi:hypothetical protein
VASKYLKNFLIYSTALVVISLLLIVWTAQLAPTLIRFVTLTRVPYVQVASINVTANGVFISLTVVNNDSLGFKPTGGWVEVMDTGQFGVVNETSRSLTAVVPLTSQWLSLGSVGVRGLINGYLSGNPAYIAFFDVIPVHVVNYIDVSGISYNDCVITVTLNASLVVPIVINTVSNMSLFTKYTAQYVFNTLTTYSINIKVPSGNHLVNLTIPIKSGPNVYAFSCSLSNNTTYVLYMPTIITYEFPNGNETTSRLFIYVFTYRGG